MNNDKYNSFLSRGEIESMGFKFIGENVLISRKASFYTVDEIVIGDNVRIDDYSLLSGKIVIGSNIHISAYVALYGNAGIFLEDYSGVSARTTIYSAVDDFSGDYMIGPMCAEEMRHVIRGSVHLEKYTQVGASCVIMPNVRIKEGTVVGAMSFVNKDLDSWSVFAGIPAKKIKSRSSSLLKYL